MADGYPHTKYEPQQKDEFTKWAMRVRMERRALMTTIPILVGIVIVFVSGLTLIWTASDPIMTLTVRLFWTGILTIVSGLVAKIVDAVLL